jgi:hypothetical protein
MGAPLGSRLRLGRRSASLGARPLGGLWSVVRVLRAVALPAAPGQWQWVVGGRSAELAGAASFSLFFSGSALKT